MQFVKSFTLHALAVHIKYICTRVDHMSCALAWTALDNISVLSSLLSVRSTRTNQACCMLSMLCNTSAIFAFHIIQPRAKQVHGPRIGCDTLWQIQRSKQCLAVRS